MKTREAKVRLSKIMSVFFILFCFNGRAEIRNYLQIEQGFKQITAITSDGKELDRETTNSILLGVGINWGHFLAAVRMGDDYSFGDRYAEKGDGVVRRCDKHGCERGAKFYGEGEFALSAGEFASIGVIGQYGEGLSAYGVRVHMTTPIKVFENRVSFGLSLRYLREKDGILDANYDILQLSVTATISK